MEKKQFSPRKTFFWIVVIWACIHRTDVFRAGESVWEIALLPAMYWFVESLRGIASFSRGAQTAIAFYTIILIIVLIFKWLNKEDRKEDT